MSILKNTAKKATAVNARELIIFSYPKVGKTELVTKLPGNYLILDFDIIGEDGGGTDFYDCNGIIVPNLEVFNKVRDAFLEEKPEYDFIVLDTFTSLYANIINSIAVSIYNEENNKSKPLNWDIDKLDYGKGHVYKREAMSKVLKFFKDYCKCLILLGHVKDSSLEGDSGTINVKDIDVEGENLPLSFQLLETP